MGDTNALTMYTNQTLCNAILTHERTEFYRIIFICVTYGAALGTLVTVPFFWCGFDKKTRDLHDDVESRDLGTDEFDDVKKKTTLGGAARRQRLVLCKALVDYTPNMKEAQENLRRTSATDVNGDFRGVWKTRLHEMSEIGGSSLELYFRLLVCMGFCFTYMSFVTSPLVVFSWHGNFLPDAGSFLVKTTVGNLGWITSTGFPQQSRLVVIGCQGIDITEITSLFGRLDIVSIGIYLLTVVYFRWIMVPRTTAENDDEVQTVADFSVEIDCLPLTIADQENYAKWLTKHLEERMQAMRHAESQGSCCRRRRDVSALPPPKVKELTLVRDYGKRLGLIKSDAKLRQAKGIAQFKNDTKTVDKITDDLNKIEAKLRDLKPEPELHVLRAYAILGTQFDVAGLLTVYRFGNFSLFRRFQSFDLRFKKAGIRIRRAPEPSTIICENQDVPAWERYVRRGVMLLVWIVAVLLSGLLIMLVNYGASTQTKGAANQSLGSAVCDSGVFPDTSYKCSYQNTSLWTKAYARNLTGDPLDCYCVTTGYTAVFADKELYNPTDGICKTWLYDTGISVAVGVMASMTIVILNYLFGVAFIAFSEFERPLSVSALEVSKMRKVCVSQFISTGIIVVLINYRSKIKIPPFGYGDFEDFERGWYTVVGGAVVTNVLINTFSPSSCSIGTVLYNKVIRHMRKGRIKTQNELLELFTNPPFDIGLRYAQVLAPVLVTLLFSSGLPILNTFSAVFCFVTFWTDKWILLRGSRNPPIYDSMLARQAANILLLAVPLHAVMGIGMFGNSCTFPSNPLGGAVGSLVARAAAVASGSSGHKFGGSGLWARATRDSTWILFVVLLLSIAFLIVLGVLGVIGAAFEEVWKVIVAVLCRRSSSKISPGATRISDDGAVQDVVAEGFCWDDVSERLKAVCPPISYQIEANVEFAPFVKYWRLKPSADEDHSRVFGVVPEVSSTMITVGTCH
eukprot:TRINITY_DN18074_c0_g1_i1.p1 TRINITY_DN18074_c0_g1~~TRINITY_DN18074_c0_g1_i1.p1  ORF type:complete len:965 (-),score=132.35 TRINITY_DN18074_c0_g1_i1:228-3122(-)